MSAAPRLRRQLPPEVAEFAPPSRPEVASACRRCRFAEVVRNGYECRRNPPAFLQARPGASVWPSVRPDDWCGEFSLGNSEGRF